MLIKTQNKEILVNMDRIIAIQVRNVYSESNTGVGILAYSERDANYDTGIMLGLYTTKDKAKVVLDMIVDANRKDRQLVPVTVEAGPTSITQFAIFEPQVFQMPQDEEVPEC